MIKIKTLYKITIGTQIFTYGLYSYITIKSKTTQPKLNIIFDLDETLIYTQSIITYNDTNNSNKLKPEPYEIVGERKIWIRPGVKQIIPLLAKFNNLYLFTKATEPYARDILHKTNLDKYFVDKKFRNDCKGTCKSITKFNLSTYSILPKTYSILPKTYFILPKTYFILPKTYFILIDDKISNQCESQNFYHIPKFNSWTKYDYQFIKLFGYVIWLNILNDLKKL